jgi:hypothetical protein
VVDSRCLAGGRFARCCGAGGMASRLHVSGGGGSLRTGVRTV